MRSLVVVTVNEPASPTRKVALFELVNTGGATTVSEAEELSAFGETRFAAIARNSSPDISEVMFETVRVAVAVPL